MDQQYYLVFDIETAVLPWESFSESQQEYLVRGAVTDEEINKKKSEMGLSPLTSQVVCIGLQLMRQIENGEWEILRRAALSVDNGYDDLQSRDVVLQTGDSCYIASERNIIDRFWKIWGKYKNIHLISFNGRNFDAPFLMLRSALLKLKPARNLMDGTKYSYQNHTDLLDKLTFMNPSSYGATKRFNFDFYTRAFGLTSPKSEGVDGSKVSEYFASGRIEEISEYCLRDVVATWKLFLIWKEFLKF